MMPTGFESFAIVMHDDTQCVVQSDLDLNMVRFSMFDDIVECLARDLKNKICRGVIG